MSVFTYRENSDLLKSFKYLDKTIDEHYKYTNK